MAKNDIPVQRPDRISIQSVEEVLPNSMLPYAEYVIMERAIPRVEDGLKPVQRRILYTMLELSLTPDKPHRKSARIVGDTLGKYHPHGDTSVYDAMVRMAQEFNMRYPLVNGHGNFGSIDGDSAAAMRYTEARMTALSMELLRHLEKDTVSFSLNFDDTLKEPDMLPARFPNLLVNGASGIAVGLATNIPPHNMGEVIDAVIERIKEPGCTLDETMRYIKAPDFPLGGYIIKSDEIKKAYETGKGRIVMRAKTHIEQLSGGKQLIVATELPYQVNKAAMLEKILALSEQKREMFAGISDIRDESDRDGTRAVIELKAGTDAKKILACLYKYSDLQVNFGVNMVAIADGQPKLMGLLEILDHYIAFQKKTVTRRLKYELEQAEKREHILSALIVAVKNIDRVIKIIRSSKNQAEARKALMDAFDFTSVQAQAILDMRLGRLTALEIETLEKEYSEILGLIARIKGILASEKLLSRLIISEHEDMRKRFADERRTQLIEGDERIEIDESDFKQVEECVVALTTALGIKRMSVKTYAKGLEAGAVDADNECACVINAKTDSKILIFTNTGSMYSFAAENLPDLKWKDKGAPLNSLVPGVLKNERIIKMLSFSNEGELVFATRFGMIKRAAMSEFNVKKSKIASCGLKEGDELICAEPLDGGKNVLVVTRGGMSIIFPIDDVPTLGRTAKGVIAIKLSPGDEAIFAGQIPERGDIAVVTERGYVKRTPIKQYEVQSRAGKGARTIAFQKNGQTGTRLAFACAAGEAGALELTLANGEQCTVSLSALPHSDKAGRGAQAVSVIMDNVVTNVILREP